MCPGPKKDAALLNGPCHSEKLKLNDSIVGLCISEKTGTSLDEFPLSAVFLLDDKPETEETYISVDSCGSSNIIKCQNGSSGRHLFSFVKGLSVIRTRKEIVLATEERAEGREC